MYATSQPSFMPLIYALYITNIICTALRGKRKIRHEISMDNNTPAHSNCFFARTICNGMAGFSKLL